MSSSVTSQTDEQDPSSSSSSSLSSSVWTKELKVKELKEILNSQALVGTNGFPLERSDLEDLVAHHVKDLNTARDILLKKEKQENDWTSQLSVRDLKTILKEKGVKSDDVDKLLERSELEELVVQYVTTLEEAQQLLDSLNNPDDDGMEKARTRDVLSKLQVILGQDRGVLNYTNYTPSPDHQKRMESFRSIRPDLFDNPKVTPRAKWFTHRHWHRTQQMPPYHIHYRVELQEVFQYLYDAYVSESTSGQERALRHAHRYLDGCLRGLHGHVSIEESYLFPRMQQVFPELELNFLYEDHQELERTEREALRALKDLVHQIRQKQGEDASRLPRQEIIRVTEIVLKFDHVLMKHLGEEEEVVVPMTLGSPAGIF